MRVPLRVAAALVVGLLACAAAPVAPAKADPYRWCAQYAGGGFGGSTNCYFITIEQCRATISGNGGFCEPNTFYDGRPVTIGEGSVSRGRRAPR